MVRDIYRQPDGNPLQINRLPQQRPETQLPYQPYPANKDARFAVTLVSGLITLSITAVGVQLMHFHAQQQADSQGVIRRHQHRSNCRRRLLHYQGHTRQERAMGIGACCLCGSGRFPAKPPLPLTLQWYFVCAILGLVSWLYARHWTYLCTASPVSHASAGQLREHWNRFLVPLAFVPLGIVLLAQVLPGPVLLALILGGCGYLVVLALNGPTSKSIFSTCRDSLISWFTYNRHDADIPGTFQSPAGQWFYRVSLTGLCTFLLAVTYVRIPSEAIATGHLDQWSVFVATYSPIALDVSGHTELDTKVLKAILIALTLLVPVVITITLPIILNLPFLVIARNYESQGVTSDNWQTFVDQLHGSTDPIERDSVYTGRVAHDNSPVLVPRTVFGAHGHFLGDTGSGKTSRGLAPLVEQLGSDGRCSIIVVDLKADSMELYSTLRGTANACKSNTGAEVPLKHVSNQQQRSTFACNPLRQPYWKHLDTYTRTDILCSALGLTYGVDYGEGYYSSANAAVLYHTIDKYPDIETFEELAERVGQVTFNAKREELHPEIRKAGSHAKVILDRLGSYEVLNVAPNRGYPSDVISEAIDFTSVFHKPQFHYYHLSSTLAPGTSPEMARLVTYSLLAAATQQKNRIPVFLVIDEFQRMVARNIEYMLQLARSMDVGVILANQTMDDLRTSTADLVPAIEANCRYRQWYSVSSEKDRRRLIEGSGETVDEQVTRTYASGPNGATRSVSYQERVVSRLTMNHILLASDDPQLSILRISRGEGYAQYGGFPIILESDYHITHSEYAARKATPWPASGNGAFVPGTTQQKPKPTPAGPSVSTVVVGASSKSSQTAANAFSSFLASSPPGTTPPKKSSSSSKTKTTKTTKTSKKPSPPKGKP